MWVVFRSYITLYENIKTRLVPHVESEVARNIIGGFTASTVAQVREGVG